MRLVSTEAKATRLAFIFAFVLMCAYYVMRPLRDAMASDWTDAEVSWLWTLNFFLCIATVTIYGAATSRVTLSRLVPGVYGFFAVTFGAFFAAADLAPNPTFFEKSFYLWLSVFSLLHISVFWSFMSDLFSAEQAQRVFGIIAAGASAGAIIGPTIPIFLVAAVGANTLMFIAAGLLLIPIPIIFYLNHLKITELRVAQVVMGEAAAIGGSPWAGFSRFARDPYLLGIGFFILLYTMISSFIYFEQKNLLAVYDREARTQILGALDWLTNTLTFGLAFFATGRLVGWLGLALTLALVPVLIAGGMLILTAAPIVSVLLALQVVRRAGNYAITRPAREMLFTKADREARFKAKAVIDTVIYRGGDMATSWIFTGLTQGLALSLGAIASIGAGIAIVWGGVGWSLGKHFEKHSRLA